MTIDLTIPPEVAHIIAAISIHENGTVAIHYVQPVSIGGILVNGKTIVGGPFTGPFEIAARVIMFEAARKARNLGALIPPDRLGLPELPGARAAILDIDDRRGVALPALPPIPGYRDPPRPAPRLMNVAELHAGPPAAPELTDGGDPTATRFSLLELDPGPRKSLPAATAPVGERCDSCGEVGRHAPDCNRCPRCGAGDQQRCDCP
jgi:hypothetical protein